MNADDFQDLYNSLRGSRSSMPVLDARGLFMDKEFQKAHDKLLEARTTYHESRSRLLKQDAEKQFAGKKDADREIRRLKRKQEKASEILETFDDLLTQLARRGKRQEETTRSRQARLKTEPPEPEAPDEPEPPVEEFVDAKAAEHPNPPAGTQTVEFDDDADSDELVAVELNVARLASVNEKFLDEFQENWGDDQLDVVGRSFGFLPVESEDDIHADALYFLRKGEDSFLVFSPPVEELGDTVTLTNVVSRKPLSPIPRDVFVQLGLQRNMVLLLDKQQPVIHHQRSEQETESVEEVDGRLASTEQEPDSDNDAKTMEVEPERRILDMGAFSQLMDAAQRSGMCPGADQIGYVRDREFKKGNFDLALQTIEGLFSKFNANAAARSQRLQQEEADIAAGRIQISPKDLQAKRSRDRAQEQAVQRARSRFNRVLDGLRILMKTM